MRVLLSHLSRIAPRLEILSLNGNAIGDAGAAALAASLRAGAAPRLKKLYLDGNPASAAAVQALRGAREGLDVRT